MEQFARLVPPGYQPQPKQSEFIREPGWFRAHHPEAADLLNHAVNGRRPWPLFVVGDVGSGKTRLGLVLLDMFGGLYYTRKLWVERVNDAQFRRLQSKAGFTLSPGEVRLEWSRASLTVMDELGTTSKVTDFAREEVQLCLDARFGKPAVYISNMDLATIGTLYDDRVASRLSGGTILHLTGDYRTETL